MAADPETLNVFIDIIKKNLNELKNLKKQESSGSFPKRKIRLRPYTTGSSFTSAQEILGRIGIFSVGRSEDGTDEYFPSVGDNKHPGLKDGLVYAFVDPIDRIENLPYINMKVTAENAEQVMQMITEDENVKDLQIARAEVEMLVRVFEYILDGFKSYPEENGKFWNFDVEKLRAVGEDLKESMKMLPDINWAKFGYTPMYPKGAKNLPFT